MSEPVTMSVDIPAASTYYDIEMRDAAIESSQWRSCKLWRNQFGIESLSDTNDIIAEFRKTAERSQSQRGMVFRIAKYVVSIEKSVVEG